MEPIQLIEEKTKEILAIIEQVKKREADPTRYKEVQKDCDKATRAFKLALSETTKIFAE